MAEVILYYPEWEGVHDPAYIEGEIVGKLVRCKDCKHRPKQTEPQKTYGFSIEFPEGSKCPCQCDDGWYSWYPTDDWFCANGEPTQSNTKNDALDVR